MYLGKPFPQMHCLLFVYENAHVYITYCVPWQAYSSNALSTLCVWECTCVYNVLCTLASLFLKCTAYFKCMRMHRVYITYCVPWQAFSTNALSTLCAPFKVKQLTKWQIGDGPVLIRCVVCFYPLHGFMQADALLWFWFGERWRQLTASCQCITDSLITADC